MPLIVAALAGGAVIVFYGAKQTKTSLASGGSGSSSAPAATGTSGAPAAGQATLTQVAKQHGWDSAEIAAWDQIIALEDASWSLTAKNPTSPAYGIAQFIQGPSEYATYGGDVGTVVGQLTAMANYIAQRYGTPTAALEYHLTHGSY
jgi:colicin import membrane protein